MSGIRVVLFLPLIGNAVGVGLESLFSDLSGITDQALETVQQALDKISSEDIVKLSYNADYLTGLRQLVQQYANDTAQLARRTEALNDKYLAGSGNSSGNDGTGTWEDFQKLATNSDYQRELQQLVEQYANDPAELVGRMQNITGKYLNGSGNMLASFPVMATAFLASRRLVV